jgi:hypothetical protein
MKFNNFAALALLFAGSAAIAAPLDAGCGTLVGAANGSGAGASSSALTRGFQVRDGEPVDFVHGAKTVHGALLVFGENGVYRAYWQPEHSAEKYVLASAGDNSIRLISTPPQGSPVSSGEPGTTLAPQRVLSCPAL